MGKSHSDYFNPPQICPADGDVLALVFAVCAPNTSLFVQLASCVGSDRPPVHFQAIPDQFSSVKRSKPAIIPPTTTTCASLLTTAGIFSINETSFQLPTAVRNPLNYSRSGGQSFANFIFHS